MVNGDGGSDTVKWVLHDRWWAGAVAVVVAVAAVVAVLVAGDGDDNLGEVVVPSVGVPSAEGSPTGVAAGDVQCQGEAPRQWLRLQWCRLPLREDLAGGPVVAGTVVVVPTESGVRAYDRIDGALRWTKAWADMSPSVMAGGGVVVVDTAVGVEVVEAETGRWRWSRQGVAVISAPLVTSTTAVLASEGTVMAARLADGSVIWQHDLPARFVHPVVADEEVVAVVEDGDLVGRRLVDGTERWRISQVTGARPTFSRLPTAGGVAWMRTSPPGGTARLMGVELASGRTRTVQGQPPVGRPIAASRAAVYVAADRGAGDDSAPIGELAVSRVDPPAGRVRWTTGVPSRTIQHAALTDHTLVVAGLGAVHGLDPETGALLPEPDLLGTPLGPPAHTGDVLHVATRTGLYTLRVLEH